MKSNFEQNLQDKMIENPENYKWGIFYFNPKDTRIMVPKRKQWMGWTLNFANIYSFFILLGILILLAGMVVFALVMENLKNS